MRRLLRRVRHGQERVQLWLRWLSNVDAGHAVLGRQLRHDPLGCASDGNLLHGDYLRFPAIDAHIEDLIAALVVHERRVRVLGGDLIPAYRIIAPVAAGTDGGADVLGGDRSAGEVTLG